MKQSPSEPEAIYAFKPAPLPPLVSTLGGFFASRDIDAYMVGGLVRDTLLGIDAEDIDLAVDGDALALGRELASFLEGHFVPLHEEFGVARVVVRSSEGAFFVDLNSMPNGIYGDLARRDFTVDAMAVRLADAAGGSPWKAVLDPYGGLEDLQNRRIRAVSPSVFEDDPARLMRAPRLASQLGFTLSSDIAEQIRGEGHLVTQVAPERVRDELLKLFSRPGARDAVRLLDRLELLGRVIPELEEAKGVTQPREHYWDVFNHLVETVGEVERVVEGRPENNGFIEQAVPTFERLDEHFAEEYSDGHTRLTLLKVAALLHDISKPATKTVEESGRIRFLGHHTEGAETARRIMRRLRFSRRGTEIVELMVRHHLRPGQMAQKGELPTGRAIYRYFRDVSDAAIDTLYLNMADFLAARGPELSETEWEEHCRVIGYILKEGLEQKAPETLSKLISGHDIMKTFDLSPGPQVGKLLDAVHEAQASGEVRTKEQALELVNDSLKAGGGGA